jgi:hypothetical protein
MKLPAECLSSSGGDVAAGETRKVDAPSPRGTPRRRRIVVERPHHDAREHPPTDAPRRPR